MPLHLRGEVAWQRAGRATTGDVMTFLKGVQVVLQEPEGMTTQVTRCMAMNIHCGSM